MVKVEYVVIHLKESIYKLLIELLSLSIVMTEVGSCIYNLILLY